MQSLQTYARESETLTTLVAMKERPALGRMTVDRLREKNNAWIRTLRKATTLYMREYALPGDAEPRKVRRKSMTLSPRRHRCERQLERCGSVQATRIRPVPRVIWPIHRSTVTIWITGPDEKPTLNANHGNLKAIEEISWDDLFDMDNTDVRIELEFLLDPILRRLRQMR